MLGGSIDVAFCKQNCLNNYNIYFWLTKEDTLISVLQNKPDQSLLENIIEIGTTTGRKWTSYGLFIESML